jgi:hypothetical protein
VIEFVARVDWSSHQNVFAKSGMGLIVVELQFGPSAVPRQPEGFNADRALLILSPVVQPKCDTSYRTQSRSSSSKDQKNLFDGLYPGS